MTIWNSLPALAVGRLPSFFPKSHDPIQEKQFPDFPIML